MHCGDSQLHRDCSQQLGPAGAKSLAVSTPSTGAIISSEAEPTIPHNSTTHKKAVTTVPSSLSVKASSQSSLSSKQPSLAYSSPLSDAECGNGASVTEGPPSLLLEADVEATALMPVTFSTAQSSNTVSSPESYPPRSLRRETESIAPLETVEKKEASQPPELLRGDHVIDGGEGGGRSNSDVSALNSASCPSLPINHSEGTESFNPPGVDWQRDSEAVSLLMGAKRLFDQKTTPHFVLPNDFVLQGHLPVSSAPGLLSISVRSVDGTTRWFSTAFKIAPARGFDDDLPSINSSPSHHFVLSDDNQPQSSDLNNFHKQVHWLARGLEDASFERVIGRPYQRTAPFPRALRNECGMSGCPVARLASDNSSGELMAVMTLPPVKDGAASTLQVIFTPQRRGTTLIHKPPAAISDDSDAGSDAVARHGRTSLRSWAVLEHNNRYDITVVGEQAERWKVEEVVLLWSGPGGVEELNYKRVKKWSIDLQYLPSEWPSVESIPPPTRRADGRVPFAVG